MITNKKHDFLKSKLVLSLLINLAFLLFCIFILDVKYEVSDDHMVDSVLSGAFNPKGSGSYDTHLLFSNILLGYPIKLLNLLIPTVSWYFVFLMTVSFASLTVIIYMILSCMEDFKEASEGETIKDGSEDYEDKNGSNVCSKALRKTRTAGIALAVIFMVYYAADMYSVLQFTKVSAAAVISGGSFFLFLLWDKKGDHRILARIAAILLTVTGVLIRSNTMGVTVPFLVLIFVYYVFEGAPVFKDSESRKGYYKVCGIRFALCSLLVGAALLLNAIGLAIFKRTDDYKKYREYNTLRASVTDTYKKGYEDVKDAFKVIGYDEVDYYMLQSWNFYDRDIYTDVYLDYVAAVLKEKSNERTHSLEYVLDQMAKRDYTSYHVFIGLIIIMIMTFIIKPGNLTWHIGNLILTFFILGVFFWTGRVVYRVEFGAIFSAAVTALVCGLFPRVHLAAVSEQPDEQTKYEAESNGSEEQATDTDMPTVQTTEPSEPAEQTVDTDIQTEEIVPATDIERNVHENKARAVSGDRVSKVCLFAMVIVMVANLFLFIPDTNYKTMTDSEYVSYLSGTVFNSANYVSGKYRVNVNSRRPFGNFVDHIEADEENYYLLDFSSCIQLIYFDYKPWERLPVGYFDENFMYLGSVTMQYPAEREMMERHGIDPDNPYKDLVKDGIYVVDNKYYEIKLMYLRKYYYPNARRELVDTIDGYMIWKFYEE